MELSKEQELLLQFARDFSEREIEPWAAEIDKSGEFPEELIEKIKKSGLIGCVFPEKYGGSDLDYFTYAMLVEEMSKYDISSTMIIAGTNSLSGWPIYKYGDEYQKDTYLTKVCEDGMIMGFALTEPNAGSDASGVQTTAVLDGDEWVLNGSKIFISNAGIADTYIILAVTDKSKGIRGISAFIVDYDTEGFTIGSYEDKMGIRGSQTGELVLKDVRIPRENLLGKQGLGFKIAMDALNGGRITVAANSVGLAQRALDESVQYSKDREQFNKPIYKNQAVSFMMAEMETKIHAARLMTYDAARKKTEGKDHAHEAAMAKYYASEIANFVVDKAVQIHGGYGYTKDYVVEKLYRDAKILEIFEGTNEIQKLVISKNLINRK